jgi:hypothetical protein
VALEADNMGGVARAEERRVPAILSVLFIVFILVAQVAFLGPVGLPVTTLIAGIVAWRFRSTSGSSSKPKMLLSWIMVGICCCSIGWVLWFSSLWFEDELPQVMFFWIVLPQLLWFGFRFLLDRQTPKNSAKIRLHTIQNKILLVVCSIAALAALTGSPHRLRAAAETRFLDRTAASIERKCASDAAPIPNFLDQKLRTWTCIEDGVSFEAGTWSKMFDRGGTWGFTKSVLAPTSQGQFGGFEEVKPLGNDWWVWKQVTWRD